MKTERQTTIVTGGLIMKSFIKMNKKIFNKESKPLYTKPYGTDTTKHIAFNELPTEVPIWTPAPQKSIFITGLQASAPLGITIILSRNGNSDFLSIRPTAQLTNIIQHFPSPYKLARDETIYVRTAGKETKCEKFGASNATQVDFNLRSDFIDVSNAVGLANGSLASLNSALIIPTSGRIVLDYQAMLPEYSRLQIERVVLKYYCRLSLTAQIGISTMFLYWRPNPTDSWIELQQLSRSIIGTLDFLSNPIEHDITDAVLSAPDPWNVIHQLQTSFAGIHTGLGLGNTIQLDAVELEICVSGINEITVFGFESIH